MSKIQDERERERARKIEKERGRERARNFGLGGKD